MRTNKRTYTLLEDVFETIDTEEKAYWLGFLYADGTTDLEKGRLKIALAEKDKTHLVKLKDFLGFNGTIKWYSRKPFNSKDYKYICQPQNELCIYSRELVRDLQSFGIVSKRKEKGTMNIDNIPPGLIRHFWRGVFDGDGCIVATDKSRVAQLSGGYRDCFLFLSFIKSAITTNVSVLKDKSIHCVKFSKGQAVEVANLLYQDCNVYLDRKQKLSKLLKASKNPVEKQPIAVYREQSFIGSFDSLIKFSKQFGLVYRDVLYHSKKYNKYKEFTIERCSLKIPLNGGYPKKDNPVLN